jgi:hypothetical protein
MKTRVKRGGFDTNDEYNTPTATPDFDNMTDKETTSTYEYTDGENVSIEDTETDENNENNFASEAEEYEFVLPQDIEDLQYSIANNQAAYANEVYGAYQNGGKRRRKSNKRKSNKRRKSNKKKSRKVKRRKSNKRRYMRGGQPALTASSDYTNRNTNTYIYKM